MTLFSMTLLAGCGAEPQGPGSAAVAATVPGGAAADGADTDSRQVVRLGDMEADRGDPATEQRNPFRFGAEQGRGTDDPDDGDDEESDDTDPDEDAAPRDRGALSLPVGGVSGGSADIPLTFLGFVESSGLVGRVVVLTDGELVFHGREGEVIDGRYRIVGLGLESVDLERVDGRGQKTLRLPEQSPRGS